MNLHEQINDSALTRELRESLTGIAAPDRPPLETITARGRAHRRHRLTGIAGLSVAGAAAGIALVLGLAGVFGSAQARGTGTIKTAAFTLVEHANGTATVTINNAPKVLLDPRALQRALRQDGIPALVTAGSFCSSDPIPAGLPQVLPGSTGTPSGQPSFTINPAAMPHGTELSFGTLYSSSRIETVVELIDMTSYTCSTLPEPFPPPYGYGVVVVYEGHLAGPNIVVSGGPGEPAGS